MVFAHEFVAQRLNENTLNKHQLLAAQAYTLDWQFKHPDDVISMFETQWSTNSHGFGFKRKQAEISLNLRGQSLIKSIHQTLEVIIINEDEEVKNLEASIELADLKSGNYYHSPSIHMSSGLNLIKMSELDWQVAQQNQQGLSRTSWHKMDRLSTLVLRFSNPFEQQVFLKQVSIPQSRAVQMDSKTVQLPCDLNIHSSIERKVSSLCVSSNYMSYLHRELAQSAQIKQLSFVPISGYSPWLWLLLSLLSSVTLCWLSKKSGMNNYLLLGVVFIYLIVTIMHWQGLVDWQQYLRWPLLVLALAVLWVYRVVFTVNLMTALPVWLLTGGLSIILWWMGGFSVEFIQLLPMYLVWACVQQIVIGPIATDFFQQQLKLNDHAVVFMVALCFALLHSPNHSLMLLTFLGGLLWSYSWQKYRNIYVNVISHSLLALLLYQAMPSEWLGSARIGVFF
ncbi:hypothetical protein MNBD_GAMMA01-283 [hydrothermal vent metagenome]|uniref:CAAX prenyl protease 2/Lysostaphin resistance protein A-like domain-containing protein n=1 Tax=hydrothermal vent metagenome TaxID=652676 RepID=A0A3B0VPP3_9ZZZZ